VAGADALALAAADSARFELRVARATLSAAPDPDAIVDWLAAHRIDVAILRVPADAGACAEGFRRAGLDPLHADSLVTWECDLQSHVPAAAASGAPELLDATSADGPAIVELLHQVFGQYRNHYNANPLLDGARAVDGYGEWALDHIGHGDRLCRITRHEGRISSLACSSHDAATGLCVGNLHGVAPACGGRGIYTELIRATQRHYRDGGFRRLRISTQLGNLTVQRVWAREGFVFAQAEHTYHLSPLFGCASRGSSVAAALAPHASTNDALWRAHRATLDASEGAGTSRVHLRSVEAARRVMRFVHVQRRIARGSRHVSLALGDDDAILGWAQTDS
jgi:hypothetical protein